MEVGRLAQAHRPMIYAPDDAWALVQISPVVVNGRPRIRCL